MPSCAKCGRHISEATAARYGGMGRICSGAAPSRRGKRTQPRFKQGRSRRYNAAGSGRGGSGSTGYTESAENAPTDIELLTIWFDDTDNTYNLRYVYGGVTWTDKVKKEDAALVVRLSPPTKRDPERLEISFNAHWEDAKEAPQPILSLLSLHQEGEHNGTKVSA